MKTNKAIGSAVGGILGGVVSILVASGCEQAASLQGIVEPVGLFLGSILGTYIAPANAE